MATELTLTNAMVARIEALGVGRALAAMLPASVAAALDWRTMAITGPDGQLDRVETVDLVVRAGAPLEDIRQALEVARRACKPSGPADAYAALMPLLAVAAKRPEAEIDAKLRRDVYSTELADYPASAVAEAARRIMRRSPFWPHVSELLTEVERAMEPRRQLLRALERAVAEADAAPNSGAQIQAPPPPSRTDRLRHVVDFHTKRGEQHRAAGPERELAEIEGRAPEAWATRRPPPTPPPPPTRESTAMDMELEQLAIAARRKLLEGK
ncbi:hypothetical protein SAMN02990966_06864 [Rhodospirillales bacterium URHD0017]|nr:hypothetical protein SAMN02990966_06864 [Rhodospirillales bacterium URHD0017]